MAKVKFKDPPINELVIGVYFDSDLPEFRIEHIGLFWNEVRDRFPVVSPQPIVSPPVQGWASPLQLAFSIEQFPMPRFWFEAADGSTLMQVQKNAFLFNWRKRDGDYPHFEAVKASFDKYLSLFLEFLAREAGATPNVHIAELTYVNSVLQGEYWKGLEDTALVLPLFRLPIVDAGATTPADFNQVSSQRLATDLMLTTTVRSARAIKDAAKPVLVFELRALGVLSETTRRDVDRWFDRAHDTIGACFLSMTSPDIQRMYWEPV